MNEHGEALGVHLASLYKCATVNLPELAERPAEANRALAGASGDSSAFSRPTTIPGTSYTGSGTGRVFPYYDQLRDALQDILAESVRNIYDSADALMQIANTYAATDAEAARELSLRNDKLRHDYDPATHAAAGNDSTPETYEDPSLRPTVTDSV